MSDHQYLDFLNDPFGMFVIKETSLIKFSECDFKEKKLSHIECNNILVANLQIVSLIAVFSVQVSLDQETHFSLTQFLDRSRWATFCSSVM